MKPEKTRRFQEKVRHYFNENKDKKHEPITGRAILAEFTFYKERPKSLTKRKEELWHGYWATRPDIDNLEKSILDALQGPNGFYHDDGQVVDLHSRKRYASRDCIEVYLRQI